MFSSYLDNIKMAFRATNPWKKSMKTEYASGWNDCLKELKKRQKSILKAIEKMEEENK